MPERPLDAGFGIRNASEDEEQVGQAVQVHSRERVRVGDGQDRPLRPAAHRPREE
jgi:hypothetical protein